MQSKLISNPFVFWGYDTYKKGEEMTIRFKEIQLPTSGHMVTPIKKVGIGRYAYKLTLTTGKRNKSLKGLWTLSKSRAKTFGYMRYTKM